MNPTRGPDLWRPLFTCFFIAGITLLVFGPTVHHAFVNFDDNMYVYDNPAVTAGLSISGVVWAFTHVYAANWHPLTWISHMCDCQLYGLNPAGHHLTNILIHTTTAVALFLVLRELTGYQWRSAFVASVFAIHPLRVESVAWIAERKDLLSGLFFMLTIAAYSRYARARSPARYATVLLSFAIGLMCKPMLVTLPFVLLLLDYWPLDRFRVSTAPRILVEKLPFFVMAGTSCVITVLAQTQALQPVSRIAVQSRLENSIISYIDYVRQMFWPANLAVLYPWEEARLGLARTSLCLTFLLLISLVVFALRHRRYLVTGWLWYLIMLIPVIGILQVGNQARADRYTYLPQIGLYLMLTWLVADLCIRIRWQHLVLAGISGIVLLGLVLSARAQVSYWQDSISLWSHALACTTDNSVAEKDAADAYYANGNVDAAIEHIQKALRIDPNQASVHSSLGVFYLEIGRVDESLAQLQKALELEPNSGDAYYNLGNTYLKMRRIREAINQYDNALAINPDDIEASNNLAWVLAASPNSSIRDAFKAVRLAEHADALTHHQRARIAATLAAAYAEAGRFGEATQVGRRALQQAIAVDGGQASAIREQLAVYESRACFRDSALDDR